MYRHRLAVAIVLSAFAVIGIAISASSQTPAQTPPHTTALGTQSSQLLLSKVSTADLEKSYNFYTKVLGLKHAVTAGQKMPPLSFKTSKEHPFIEIPLNFTGSLADPFFVLVKQEGVNPAPEWTKLIVVGFKVPDARLTLKRIKEAGYEIVRDAPPPGPGNVYAMARDPDGYMVELIQAPNYPASKAGQD
jgi:catechol 2,3-dioxygenase-like lactoylglutathione lyase family enzyme